jgi:7 transmembrane receptor (rhodopsin family)
MNIWMLIVVVQIFQYTGSVTAYASVYTLVLMALDRYLAIVHPIASIKWRTTNRTGIVLVITWVRLDQSVIQSKYQYQRRKLLIVQDVTAMPLSGDATFDR